MKKLINYIEIGLVAVGMLVGVNAKAVSVTYTLAANGVTNVFTSPVKLTQVLIQGTNVSASVNTWFFDAPSTVLTNVVGAYTNTLTYGTNFVTTWTNFWGGTNSVTNIAIVEVSNPVIASTNTYQIRLAPVGTGTTLTKYDNVNYYFVNGLTITNSGTGTATIGITYQQ